MTRTRRKEPWTLSKAEGKKLRKRASSLKPGRKRPSELDPVAFCAGCDQKVGQVAAGWSFSGNGAEVRLAKRAQARAWACASSTYTRDKVGKKTCLRRAYERLALCPGCGRSDREVAPGRLCSGCHGLIAAGRSHEKQQAQRDVRWYVIDTVRLFGYLGGKARALGRDLAQACCAPGHEWGAEFRSAVSLYESDPLVVPPRGNKYLDRRALECDPCVELSPAQAEALKSLCRGLQTAFRATKETARQAGGSLLMRLANGGMTIDQFNDRSARPNPDCGEWDEEDGGEE